DGLQPLQPVFEDVVGRAALERFDGALLAERARHEDERYAWAQLLCDSQCCQTVESREGVVGEHEVDVSVGERVTISPFSADVPPVDLESVLLQLELDELGVARIVLEQDDL